MYALLVNSIVYNSVLSKYFFVSSIHFALLIVQLQILKEEFKDLFLNIPRFGYITEIHDINTANFIKHLSWDCNNWHVKKSEACIVFELNKSRKSTKPFTFIPSKFAA